MNKLVKGSIAGAAGIALLLGGAGTLALWNTGLDVEPGTITAGELELTDGITAASNEGWSSNGVKISDADFATYHVVPGETLTYVKTVHVKAVGDKIKAVLGFDYSGIIPTIGTSNRDLGMLLAGSTFTATYDDVATSGHDLVFNSTTGEFTGDVTITATVPIADANGEVAMNQSIDLNNLKIVLKQVS